MADHVIQPRRTGRKVVCVAPLDDGKPCGRPVVMYRATRLIPKRHWRHMSWQQSYIGERSALKAKLGV